MKTTPAIWCGWRFRSDAARRAIVRAWGAFKVVLIPVLFVYSFLRFVVHLAETTAKFLGGAPEFPQRFVERVLELLFEVPCHRPEVRIHARNSSDDSREAFRSEHHQTRHQQEENLAAGQVEHSVSIRDPT